MSRTDDVAPDLTPDVTPEATGRTGHPGVDAVLSSMDSVGGLPVAEHVAVFEQAHQRLRAALAGADDVVPPPSTHFPSRSA